MSQPPTEAHETEAALAEARETLRAIGAGEVDAFVVSDEGIGHSVLSLSTVDRPYRLFVENMRDGAATVDEAGRIQYANARLVELLSCPWERVVGSLLSTFIAGEAPDDWYAPAGIAGHAATLEVELVDQQGANIPVLMGASPLTVDGTCLTCLTFTDLTVQKAQEREIARLNSVQMANGQRFAAVVAAMHEGVLVQDGEGRVLEANQTASDILGVPLAELVTDPPSPLPWHGAAPTGATLSAGQTPGRQALDDGQPVLGVMTRIDRGKERVWLEINSVPLRFGEAETPVVISSFRDVTQRVAADEEIRFQARLLDAAGQAIIATDEAGILVYWNQQAERMYGWSADEAIGQPVVDVVLSEETTANGQQMFDQVSAGKNSSGDIWVKRRDGTVFPVFATASAVFDDDEHLVAMIGVASDITDRRRDEARMRQLSAIVDSSSDAIVGMTLDRVIASWNPGATACFGYEPDEAIGQHVSMLAASVERDAELTRLGARQGMSLTDVETECITKHGTLIRVSLSVSPVLDAAGAAVGLSCIARDVTERIRLKRIAIEFRDELLIARHATELETIVAEEAQRANRAKSEFLARMSHELRTPLNAVLGFGQILMMDDLSADQRENVGFIASAGTHLLELINDVLDIARIEAGGMRLSLEPVHLNEVVNHALTLIRPQAAENNISLPTGIDDCGDLYVRSDRHRLLQVLLNLLSNAVKYNRPGGRIDLCCESSGGTVSIAVRDTGFGIPEGDLGRIFTPFERLGADRTAIQGSGVGLALSRVLSQEMAGSLTASSTVGTGSTFVLEMPASDEFEASASDEADDSPAAIATNTKGVTVLAIDDNVGNIRLLERALQRRPNVELLTTIQGRRGLEIASQHRPDLILLDLHLPDVPGEEVLRRLVTDPSTAAIPVVICTADASPQQRSASLTSGAAGYLTKPLDLTNLYEIIERVRDQEPFTPMTTDPKATP